jgi:hypothetical protein
VWFGFLRIKSDEEIKRLIDQAIRIEEQSECPHTHLKALFPNDIWYRCELCNQVWVIYDAMQIKAKAMPQLIKKLQQVTKMTPKNKKVTSLNDSINDSIDKKS